MRKKFQTGLAVATLLQARFSNSFAVTLAAFFALTLQAAWRPSVLRVGKPVGFVGLAALSLWMWLPVADAYVAELPKWRAVLQGGPRVHSAEDRYWAALFETATWLRERTPSPGDPYDPEAEPAFGVLGHWQYGHVVQYVGQRPAVVGNFGDDVGGDNYSLSFAYFETTEARAVEILDALRVRYVLIRPLDVARGDHGPGSMIRRLADPNGGALARHRLLYERPVLKTGSEGPRSHFRVYERVRGARVTGLARPGSVVEARLGYVSPTGRRGELRRTVKANDRGVYRLRLPYATVNAAPGLELAGAWEVGVVGASTRQLVGVEEIAVQEGRRVDGPDLRP